MFKKFIRLRLITFLLFIANSSIATEKKLMVFKRRMCTFEFFWTR